MALILVIEDEPTTRMLHARALSDLPGASVVSAATVAEATEMIEREAPDLVLLDLRLPDGNGLDVLKVLAERRLRPTVVVVSGFPEDLSRPQQYTTSHLLVVPKPVPPAELRCRVLEVLQLERPHSAFSLPEYLQMACLGGHTLFLNVTGDRRAGYVAVNAGQVWSASYGTMRAFEAFHAMVVTPELSVDPRPWPPGEELPRQLAGGHQALLLEALRRHDEADGAALPALSDEELDFSDLLKSVPPPAVASSPPPSSHCGAAAPEAKPNHSVAELVALGVQAVIAREYEDAAFHLRRAAQLEPDNTSIQHRLQRLHQLGYGTGARAAGT